VSATRLFFALLKWDLLREVRRRDTVLNMSLFAILLLFLAEMGLGPLLVEYINARDPSGLDPRFRALAAAAGPVLFWLGILFAGSVGLSQSFAAEREGNALGGIQLAPMDLGVFYLAKVAATWIYVMVMGLLLLGAYILLFNFDDWGALPPLLAAMAVFILGYMASGVVLSAITTALRGGGEVVLRILILPLLMPLIYLTLRVQEATFGAGVAGAMGEPPLNFPHYLALALAFDAIYLASGFLLFPKVLEE
jgi:heme exporter protein CcmB